MTDTADAARVIAICAGAAFIGTAAGQWTWVRFSRRLVPNVGDCIAYGLGNAWTATWASALALVLLGA